jgi:hypothetical protein
VSTERKSNVTIFASRPTDAPAELDAAELAAVQELAASETRAAS